jgi:hypothetical protein
MPKGNISEIKCRHCGRTIKATGFWHHLTAAHQPFSYEKELVAHGISRASPGQKWQQGAGLAPAPPSQIMPSQIMGTQPALEPAAPEPRFFTAEPRENGRLTITRKALEMALSGLEYVRGELDTHIADVRATLEPPRRKYMKQIDRLIQAEVDHDKPRPPGHQKGAPGSAWLPRQHSGPVATYTYRKGPGGSHKVWSNDPEGKYRHFADTGEIMRKASDGKPWEKSPMTPAVLAAIKKARAARWR